MPAPTQRSLTNLNDTIITHTDAPSYYFVRIEAPTDPPGVLRFRNGPFRKGDDPHGYAGGPAYGIDLGIPEGTQAYTEADLSVEGLAQTNKTMLEVSSINFSNLDGFWTEQLFDYGLRWRFVEVWAVWWNNNANLEQDGHQGYYKLYEGRVDEAEVGLRCNLSLEPHRQPHNVTVPGREYIPTCGYIYKDVNTCQYVGAIVGCDRTRNGPNGCAAHGNLSHFGGFDFLPEPNTSLVWGDAGNRFHPG